MAARILWDMHEAAVLFQAMLRVLAGEIKRKDAVSDVSSKLREMAIGRGIKIDEKYRNENGVSLQMNCIEYAYKKDNQDCTLQTDGILILSEYIRMNEKHMRSYYGRRK